MDGDMGLGQSYDFYTDLSMRIRDIEEKQRLMKDRLSLVGKTFIEQRDRTFQEIRDLKVSAQRIELEQKRIRELLQRLLEHQDQFARREELMVLQRQFDMFRA